jgi:hypothetical protein
MTVLVRERRGERVDCRPVGVDDARLVMVDA